MGVLNWASVACNHMELSVLASSLIREIRREFHERFGYEPVMARAPGRINIIGEHTDYNQGFVLPGSIENAIYFAVGKGQSGQLRALAFDYSDYQEIPLKDLAIGSKWINYVYGVVKEMEAKSANIKGIDVVFGGDIPAGAGLSSSAALTCGLATALDCLFDLNLSKWDIALLGQRVEHDYVGVQCGIMDQFASVFGKKDHVMRLDCRSHDYEYFELDLGSSGIVLCDSGVKHSLASTEYNIRRDECDQGLKILALVDSQLNSLRDVTSSFLASRQDDLPPTIFSRCKYVVDENERVQKACQALSEGKISILGELMFQTHLGLKNDYEVSCPELDQLVEWASNMEGVIGSRMMGGGFGGCSINIVEAHRLEAFREEISRAFEGRFGSVLKTYDVHLADGAGVLGET